MKKSCISLLMILCSSLLFADGPPKLIIQIVIDQLRGDLIERYHSKFSAQGFNYLLNHGIDYHNAHHPHANTVTCVGHATIATGSYPSLHGIVSNDWYDRKTHKTVYCMDDAQSPILPTLHTKIIPSGRSPRNLLTSTLSDEIVLAQRGRAFGVSLKDRAAITLAGHAGKAFWFDKENGGFVSSSYYYKTYPLWVENWNKQFEAKEASWDLHAPLDSYYYAKASRFKNRFPDFGLTFPHHLGSPQSSSYYKFFSMTPMADELTANFAIALLKNEKLGKLSAKTDYLAISFSAMDAIGHQFGPNSLESEDNLLRLDLTLANLFATIEQEVGLKNTLIVLTADHGVSDSSIYLNSNQIHRSEALKIQQLQAVIEHALLKRFNLPKSALASISFPYIYLDQELLNEKQLSIKKVSAFLVELLDHQPGIFKAYSLVQAKEQGWIAKKVAKMAFSNRSGDIYLVSPPYQVNKENQQVKVNHGTPWVYDSYVPLIFAHPAFKPQRVFKPVSTVDIAPTLAALLAITAPSAAVGLPLTAVVKPFKSNS